MIPILLGLKRPNGLKTSYDDTFDKILDFFDQNYHFLDFLTLKRKNWIKNGKNETCAAFNPKTRKKTQNDLW